MPKAPKEEVGVLFPADATGKRSTIAGGKAVWAAAAAAVDPALADAIMSEKNWRGAYEKYVTKLMEAGAASESAAVAIAEAGIASFYASFEFVRDGVTSTVPEAMAKPDSAKTFSSASVTGGGAPVRKLVVPYEGARLEGDALLAQLRVWASAGTMEPGVETALASLVQGGEAAMDLSQHVFVVLGATSALGPLRQLLAWGATVVGVARSKQANWAELISYARSTAGTLIFPVRGAAAGAPDAELAAAAGADLMADTPEVLEWLKRTLPATGLQPVVGMYTYLDSDAHVRVSLACDAIMRELAPPLGKASLAYIQTPSLAYDVPASSVEAAKAQYASSWLKMLGYTPNARSAVPGTQPPRYVHNGFINLQGPNYALAKNLQLWRATLGHARDKLRVSANMAPAARTASMVAGDNKNASTVATGLNGMGYFKPLMCFDQETVSTCMAALLLTDVTGPMPAPGPHPYDLFSYQAFHGGSFRVGVKPGELGTLFYLSGKLFGPASAL